MTDFAVCVPWANRDQFELFLHAWEVPSGAEWLFAQQDVKREGCARTKNRAIRRAVEAGAETIVVLDDDCYPEEPGGLLAFCEAHARALEPQAVEMFEAVTDPPSRGTPYLGRSLTMPVAASMGFWTQVGDHCAVRQLALASPAMTFRRQAMFGRYFPLCGMNYAFRPRDWDPWFYLVEDVGRFDDIWMGWMWQREAYRRGACFNLAGPSVRHVRQSNVWRNLRDEARLLEESETLWQRIATAEPSDRASLQALLPTLSRLRGASTSWSGR